MEAMSTIGGGRSFGPLETERIKRILARMRNPGGLGACGRCRTSRAHVLFEHDGPAYCRDCAGVARPARCRAGDADRVRGLQAARTMTPRSTRVHFTNDAERARALRAAQSLRA